MALGDNADHIVALLAIAWLGAVILPMDVRWTPEEKRRLATHFGARFVLVPRQRPADRRRRDDPGRRGMASCVAAHGGNGRFVRRRDQPLLLSLSSGTTGTPKGPLVTHGHTLSRLFIYAFSLTFNEADRFITATPLYFGGARYMTMAYLFMGATVVLFPPPYEPDSLVQAVNDQRITALFLVPTLLRRLLDLPKPSLPLMPGVRRLISSGSALYPDERRRIMREVCPGFFNFYSSTEGGGISLLRPEHPDEASLSTGQVVFGAEVQIVDENHAPVPAGTVGAIRYRGGAVANSYYRNPVESAAAFRDGWYYPGDLGRFDADGFPLSDGPLQGHDHPRRRQHLPGRDRADAGAASRRGGSRRGRLAVTGARRRGRGLRGVPRARERTGPDRALPRLARALQGAEGRVLPRSVAEERDGQGAESHAGGAADAATSRHGEARTRKSRAARHGGPSVARRAHRPEPQQAIRPLPRVATQPVGTARTRLSPCG